MIFYFKIKIVINNDMCTKHLKMSINCIQNSENNNCERHEVND